jgi:potassium-transporting ATPase KdpC subunit
MLRQLKISLLMLLVLSALTGLAYPLAVTGLAKVLFSRQAEGSLVEKGGTIVGSSLIGQPFDDPKYFWSRPSATSPAYNASSSTGSNQGPLNPDYLKAVKDRVDALRKADPGNTASVPVDLVTASGSGLDPHISPAAAEYQAARVARARALDRGTVEKLIEDHTQGRLLGLFGEPAVNVLELNLALDGAKK